MEIYMAQAKRRTNTRRKKAAPLPRKSRTGIDAAPTKSFHAFQDYFRLDLERKDISIVLKGYIRDKFKGEDRKLLLSAPEYMYTSMYGPAASIQWKNLGHDWPVKWNGKACAQRYIDNVRVAALRKVAEVKKDTNVKRSTRSPMDVVKDRTSDFIGGIEEALDLFHNDQDKDLKEYSVYNEMTRANLNSFSAGHVVKYYKPLLVEITELVNNKSEDLVEAYSNWSIPRRKKYLQLIQNIVDDAERYVAAHKAKRKPSKPKVKTADKQVSKLNYAKDSSEHKLASINPTVLVGATRVYTFNVRYRVLTEYITDRPKGFEVRGSTIYGIDAERSRQVRLRKPAEQLNTFLTATPIQINKFWAKLTTKTTYGIPGRINKDTILLRALDK
jgi:hypothetical protein